jgi:hypothetical protein
VDYAREIWEVRRDRIAASLRALPWLEIAAVAFAVLLYVKIHAAYIVSGFGETDAARAALQAALQHLHIATTPALLLRTSPLYVDALRWAADLGMRLDAMPRVMNWASLTSCAVALCAAYCLFRIFVGRLVSAVACVLLAMTPAFWLGANYGMAHTVALATLQLSLLSFAKALDEGISRRRLYTLMALALVFLTLTLAFKSDFILDGLAFPALAWLRRRPLRYFGVAGCALVLVALAVQMLYAKALSSNYKEPSKTTVEWAKHWHEKWPFTMSAILEKKNLGAITHSMGPFLFAIAAFALASHLLMRREKLRLGVWAAASSLPVILFWGFVTGNSVRHNLSALAPLMLLVASLIVRITESPFRAATLTTLLLTANYYSDTKGGGSGTVGILPRTNLIELSRDLQKYSEDARQYGQEFIALDAEKKALVARDVLAPVTFYVLSAAADRHFKLAIQEEDYALKRHGKIVQQAHFSYCANARESWQAVRELREAGYTVWHHDC